MRKFLSILILASLLFSYSESTAVAAGTKYIQGKKGGCYTLVKSKNTGKTYKKYVNITFCKKK